MPNLGNYQEPVPFNQAAADSLVGELLATARVLGRDISDREQFSRRARQSWEGPHAQQFDGRNRICAGDARRFETALRAAVQAIEQLARLATEEERRRAAVRAGIQQWHAACLQADAYQQPRPPWQRYVPQTPPIEPPRIPSIDCPPTPRLAAASTGGGMTGRSSADPDLLDRFVAESRAQDKFMEGRLRVLEGACNAFLSSSRNWGNFDVSPLIASLRTYIGYNGEDASWTSTVSQAFRSADSVAGADSSDGGMRPTAAITTAMMKAPGLPISTGSRKLETLPESRVRRNAAGLISRVDDRPVDQYLRDIGRQRSAQSQGTSSVVTAVAMNRRTGEVVEGSPLDAVKGGGASSISRIAHVGGREPDVTTRLDIAEEQVEIGEWMRRSGDSAMVPALVRAARASIDDMYPRSLTNARARSRLGDLNSRLNELETWMPRRRDQPLTLTPRENAHRAISTVVPPETQRVYVRDGLLVRASTDRPLEAPPRDLGYWSYVTDEHGNFYVVQPQFGHRGVLGDRGRVSAAGMLGIVPGRPGMVSHLNTQSGGFPNGSLRQLQELVEELGLDLSNVSEFLENNRERVAFDNSVRRAGSTG